MKMWICWLFHDWEKWSEVDKTEDWYQTKACKRCNKISVRDLGWIE